MTSRSKLYMKLKALQLLLFMYLLFFCELHSTQGIWRTVGEEKTKLPHWILCFYSFVGVLTQAETEQGLSELRLKSTPA